MEARRRGFSGKCSRVLLPFVGAFGARADCAGSAPTHDSRERNFRLAPPPPKPGPPLRTIARAHCAPKRACCRLRPYRKGAVHPQVGGKFASVCRGRDQRRGTPAKHGTAGPTSGALGQNNLPPPCRRHPCLLSPSLRSLSTTARASRGLAPSNATMLRPPPPGRSTSAARRPPPFLTAARTSPFRRVSKLTM